jgi:hypothetical protein
MVESRHAYRYAAAQLLPDLGASGQACLCASKGLLLPRPYAMGSTALSQHRALVHHTPNLIYREGGESLCQPARAYPMLRRHGSYSGQRSLTFPRLWIFIFADALLKMQRVTTRR